MLPISSYRAEWKCNHCGGKYNDYVNVFVDKHLKGEDDCPYCNNRKALAGVNTLETTFDDVEDIWDDANEKHYTELLPTSSFLARWKCTRCCGKYNEYVNVFVDKHLKGEDDCPYCNNRKALAGLNSLDKILDDVEDIWSDANEKHYSELLPTSSYKAEWKCNHCSGKYNDYVNVFVDKHLRGEDDCPYCNNRKALAGLNSLDTILDDVEDIWSDANEKHYSELLPTSSYRAEWKCNHCGGKYNDYVNVFVDKHLRGEDDCPYCNNRKPLIGFNTLKKSNPDWLLEWSYQNNYLICNPDEILPDYGDEVWWKCNKCSYDYQMSPKNRYIYIKRHKISCPKCKGLRRKVKYFF